MELLSEPRRPSMHPAVMFAPYLERYSEWSPFVTAWGKQSSPVNVGAYGTGHGSGRGSDLGVAAS